RGLQLLARVAWRGRPPQPVLPSSRTTHHSTPLVAASVPGQSAWAFLCRLVSLSSSLQVDLASA
ncbi:MAG: hypothetical protein P4L81_00035, partial [Candidatus Pacebacteria bacterium]|nr:hypothetical protein [Candidatus Paceibacterota bacterium]